MKCIRKYHEYAIAAEILHDNIVIRRHHQPFRRTVKHKAEAAIRIRYFNVYTPRHTRQELTCVSVAVVPPLYASRYAKNVEYTLYIEPDRFERNQRAAVTAVLFHI
jgi:hypothetical protein